MELDLNLFISHATLSHVLLAAWSVSFNSSLTEAYVKITCIALSACRGCLSVVAQHLLERMLLYK